MHGVVLLEMVKSHTNETYLSRVIDEVEGKSKGPKTLVKGTLLNEIKSITSGSPENLIDGEAPDVRITPTAKLHLQNKLCWFSEQKSMKNSANAGFRSDQICLLVLSHQLFMDIPANVKSLLWYKQEEINHSCWLTAANGYLRMLLFHSSDLTTVKTKLSRLVSYIFSVYLPSFLMTHLKPHACEGPFVTLFQMDLLLAFGAVNLNRCKGVKRYVLQHAKSWLSPHNIALSVYSENLAMTKEVLASLTLLPKEKWPLKICF